MTPEQFNQFLAALQQIAPSQYTITGAADWPMLVAIGGMFMGVLLYMWHDLRSVLKENRTEGKGALQAHIEENKEDHNLIWKAFHECQGDCCPRTKKD